MLAAVNVFSSSPKSGSPQEVLFLWEGEWWVTGPVQTYSSISLFSKQGNVYLAGSTKTLLGICEGTSFSVRVCYCSPKSIAFPIRYKLDYVSQHSLQLRWDHMIAFGPVRLSHDATLLPLSYLALYSPYTVNTSRLPISIHYLNEENPKVLEE